jgi:hypothetical protein
MGFGGTSEIRIELSERSGLTVLSERRFALA